MVMEACPTHSMFSDLFHLETSCAVTQGELALNLGLLQSHKVPGASSRCPASHM